MTMTQMQYLLGKLAEEASELSQIALKTQQFGFDSCHPQDSYDNIQRIQQEYNDVLAVVSMINEHITKNNIVVSTLIHSDIDQIFNKIGKVYHYAHYSKELGMVE